MVIPKCLLTIEELNWYELPGDADKKLKICHQVLTLSTQLQDSSFHVVERTRITAKCTRMENAHVKHAKLVFFIVYTVNVQTCVILANVVVVVPKAPHH